MTLNLERYYRGHRHRIYGYLLRLCGDAEVAADVCQESFLRYAASYGTERVEPTLLYRIARNRMMDVFRKTNPCAELTESCIDERDDPEAATIVQDEFQRMLAALQRLRPEERDILALVSGDEDLRYRDIAAILGISEGNARIRVHRARIRLQEEMKRR